jgi:hypothetical protein
MASKDPLDPADMHTVYISGMPSSTWRPAIRVETTYLALATEARCNSHLLHTSKKYRLHFTIQPPATVIGLRSPKSDYIKAAPDAVMWKGPFRDEL